jgi:hypothetical protein
MAQLNAQIAHDAQVERGTRSTTRSTCLPVTSPITSLRVTVTPVLQRYARTWQGPNSSAHAEPPDGRPGVTRTRLSRSAESPGLVVNNGKPAAIAVAAIIRSAVRRRGLRPTAACALYP